MNTEYRWVVIEREFEWDDDQGGVATDVATDEPRLQYRESKLARWKNIPTVVVRLAPDGKIKSKRAD